MCDAVSSHDRAFCRFEHAQNKQSERIVVCVSPPLVDCSFVSLSLTWLLLHAFGDFVVQRRIWQTAVGALVQLR